MKKTPERQCLGCRTKNAKRDLVRVVRSPEGAVSLDLTGKKSGRGAYICPRVECLRRVVKSRALERQLKVEIPGELVSALEQQMENLPSGVPEQRMEAGIDDG